MSSDFCVTFGAPGPEEGLRDPQARAAAHLHPQREVCWFLNSIRSPWAGLGTRTTESVSPRVEGCSGEHEDTADAEQMLLSEWPEA